MSWTKLDTQTSKFLSLRPPNHIYTQRRTLGLVLGQSALTVDASLQHSRCGWRQMTLWRSTDSFNVYVRSAGCCCDRLSYGFDKKFPSNVKQGSWPQTLLFAVLSCRFLSLQNLLLRFHSRVFNRDKCRKLTEIPDKSNFDFKVALLLSVTLFIKKPLQILKFCVWQNLHKLFWSSNFN